MWPSKISNAVGTRNAAPPLTRDALREELQLFAKESFREELELLKKEIGESFQQRLEIFRHELEAFFQTWAYELARGRQSQRYSLADALADTHSAAVTRARNSGPARRSTDSPATPVLTPRNSQKVKRIVSGKARISSRFPKVSQQEPEEATHSQTLTSGWMNRHRRNSQSGSIVEHGQAVEKSLSQASDRRSQVCVGTPLPQSWMHRHRRSSGSSAELKEMINEYRRSNSVEEKKPANSIGDIVAAIVKPTQKSNMGWLKRHTDSYRQLQLTQETVLKAVCPLSDSPETSYSLIPAPIAELERNKTSRESHHSTASTGSQDMAGSLASTVSASFAAPDLRGPNKVRQTYTWAGGDDDAFPSPHGDIDDAIRDLRKTKNPLNAMSSGGAKPSLKRGFTMGGGNKKSMVANPELSNSWRRGSQDNLTTAARRTSSENTFEATMSSQFQRASNPPGVQQLQAVSEGREDTSEVWRSASVRRDSQDLLLSLEDTYSDSGKEGMSEFGDTYEGSFYIDRLAELINSSSFTYALTSMILINSLIFGFETDWKAQHWSTTTPLGFRMCDYFFCSAFLFEIALRICVHGCAFFSTRWNVFDFMVVFLQLAHQVMSGVSESENIRNIEQFVPVLLMARLFRIFRAASMAHLFSELRMLIISIVDSLKSICWAMVLLVLVTYVSSVYFTQVVTIHKVRHGLGDEEQALEGLYGSLGRSMMSLFECVSNGISWHEVMDPLMTYCSPFMTIVFVLYIMFTMFVVLNVITGIFVETATQKANEDKKKVLMLKLKEFFHHADSDGSGTMTWEKFERQLEIPEMKVYLKAIDLDQEEAWDLFQLLDMDDSNEIDIEEFVNGCLRLHGEAKALDLATFMYNYKEWTNLWTEHVEQLETTLARVEDLVVENSLKSEQNFVSLSSRIFRAQTGQQSSGDESHAVGFAPELSDSSRFAVR